MWVRPVVLGTQVLTLKAAACIEVVEDGDMARAGHGGFSWSVGLPFGKGPSYLAEQLRILFADGEPSFSGRLLRLLQDLKQEWDELDRRIEEASDELALIAKSDDACQRLMEVPGFGPVISIALAAAIGNGISFHKGRDLAAWLGLVPRQHTTGGRPRLLGISKLGNEYLRRMMLHGARPVVMQVERKPSAEGKTYFSSPVSACSSRRTATACVAGGAICGVFVFVTRKLYCPA